MTEPREAGVGFAIRTKLVSRLSETLLKGVNDRLMTMRIPLICNSHLTLISAYAPTMTYSDAEKEKFYLELSNTLDSVPKNDKLLILGDFNARVGNSCNTWPNVMGHHGIGKMNSNGLLLLSFCTEKGLTITNTLYELPVIHKSTWMHPRSKRDGGTLGTFLSHEQRGRGGGGRLLVSSHSPPMQSLVPTGRQT